MAEQIFIGSNISFPLLRDYVIEHKINRGDSIALNPMNYEKILEEIRHSHGESIEIPINILGVLLVRDTGGNVDPGKIQIIKNETLNN